jgi:hypothetical protein
VSTRAAHAGQSTPAPEIESLTAKAAEAAREK